MDRQSSDIALIDKYAAAIGGDQTDDHVEAGRLAGAVGAQQADNLAAHHVERNIADNSATLVTLPERSGAQAAGLELWARGCATLSEDISHRGGPPTSATARRRIPCARPSNTRSTPALQGWRRLQIEWRVPHTTLVFLLRLNHGAHARVARRRRAGALCALHTVHLAPRVVSDVVASHFVLVARHSGFVEELEAFGLAIVLDAQRFAVDPLVGAVAFLAERRRAADCDAVLETFLVLPHGEPLRAQRKRSLREHDSSFEYGDLFHIVRDHAIRFDIDRLLTVGALRACGEC